MVGGCPVRSRVGSLRPGLLWRRWFLVVGGMGEEVGGGGQDELWGLAGVMFKLALFA